MNRRNFITTGLLGALPIPSINFAETKPNAKPKTLNELLVKIEQETQYLIKSKIESWGFTVVEGWPSWDQPETMYFQCGVVHPKLRTSSVQRLNRIFYGFTVDQQDIAQVSSLPRNAVARAIKHMQDLKHSFTTIVFLQCVAHYNNGVYSDGPKVCLDVHFDWVRQDSIKLRDRAHLRQLLNKHTPTA